MCTTNPKATMKQNKPTKKLRVNDKKNYTKIRQKERKNKTRTDGTNRKQQDGRFKPNHINNHLKYKWSIEREIIICINKTKFNYMLYSPVHLLEWLKIKMGHTKC